MNWKTRGLLLSGLAIAVIGVAGWQPRPATVDVHRPLLNGAVTPQPVMKIVERACQDCHSERTHWPWYSQVKPVAKVLLSDVEKGKQFLNLSQWDNYTRGQKLGFLTAIAAATNNGRMPPRGYALLHPQSKLNDMERSTLRTWAKEEAGRVRRAPRPSQPQS